MINDDARQRIWSLALLSLALLALVREPVLSQDDTGAITSSCQSATGELVPRGHFFGWTASIAVDPTDPDQVYLGEGSGLTVFDATNPLSPTYEGSFSVGTGDVTAIVPVSTTAYAVNGDGLRVIDVSEPTTPTLSGSLDLSGTVGALAVTGSYAYVARAVDWTDGWLHAIDISDPENPALLASYDTPGGARDVSVVGDPSAGSGQAVVYVADGDALLMLDGSDPLTLTELASYEPPEPVHAATVVSTTAYLLTRGTFPFFGAHLRIVDVSDPANPDLLGSYDALDDAEDLHVAGPTAYVADGDSGLQILDVSDPQNPVHLGTFDDGWSISSVAASGSRAYVASAERGFAVLDVSDPENPDGLGEHDRPSAVMDVVVDGTSGYIAGYDRLWTVDLTNPVLPVPIGSSVLKDLVGEDKQITLAPHPQTGIPLVYVAEQTYGLEIFDVTDAASPTPIGEHPTPGVEMNDVAALGDYAYFLTDDGDDGQLHVLDVSDPTDPQETDTYDTPGDARQIVVTEALTTSMAAGARTSTQTMAYVADGPAGLRIIDVSDPNDAIELNHIDPPTGGATDLVKVIDGRAWVGSNTGSAWHVQVFDVTDPLSPTLLGEQQDQGRLNDLDVDEDYFYVALGRGGTTASVRALWDVLWPADDDIEVEYGVRVYTGGGRYVSDRYETDYWGGYQTEDADSVHRYTASVFGVQVRFTFIDKITFGAEVAEVQDPPPGDCAIDARIEPAKAQADGCTLSPLGTHPCQCGSGDEIVFEAEAVNGWEFDSLNPPAPVTCPAQGTTAVVGQFAPFVTIAGSGNEFVCVGREDASVEERTKTVLAFTIQASEADTWELTSLTFEASGEGDDAAHVAEVRLYHGGSQIGSGGAASYSGDDGTVTFTFPKIVITTDPASFRLDYVFDFEGFGNCATQAKEFTASLIDPDSGLEPQNYKPGKYQGGAAGSVTVGCVMHEDSKEAFETIQEGVDAASSGTTILVCPGSYEENVDVSRSVTIRSTEGPDETTIRAARTEESAVTLDAPDSTIEGFTIKGSNEAGLLLRATGCTVADSIIRENGKNGVHAPSGQVSGRNLLVTENGGYGIYAPGPTSAIEVADIDVTNNGRTGIWAQHGTVSISGPSKANGNGKEYSQLQCLNWGVGGIVAEGAITTQDIEASDNCGYGLASVQSSIHVQGGAVARNNTRGGIRAKGDVALDGASHIVSDNGDEGIYARGAIRVIGPLTVDNNNTWAREHAVTRCWNQGTAGLLSWKDVTVEDIVATRNCGYGVAAVGSVTVKGSATVLHNENAGIRGPAGVSLLGTAHSISHNGIHGIDSNGDVRLASRVSLNDNGRRARERGLCGSTPGAGLSVHGDISADDIEIRSNCGSGVRTGGRLLVTNRAQILYNTQSGIAASDGVVLEGSDHEISSNGSYGVETHEGGIIDIRGSARVNDNEIGLYGSTIKLTSGEVCGNTDRGIIVRSGGTLSQGAVKVCDNGGTGIDHAQPAPSEEQELSAIAAHHAGPSTASVSRIAGSAIVGNGGDGIRFAGAATELMISESNIESNAGYGVYSIMPGIVTARQNWWGNAGGPGGTGAGDGDEVTGTVTFDPWLVEPVSFAVVIGEDPVYAPQGSTASNYAYIRNWGDAGDTINVTISDTLNWLSGPSLLTVSLEAGGEARVPVSFTVPSTVTLDTTNVVTVAAIPQNNPSTARTATFCIIAASVADLAVAVEHEPDFPLSTGLLTYALSVTNAGPDIATGLILTDTLPQAVTIHSVQASQGSCAQQGQGLICSLGSLSMTEQVEVTVTVAPPPAGVVTNTVAVDGNERDPQALNNTVHHVSAVDLSDLSVTIIEAPDLVYLGDLLRYTMTVANDGPASATGVVMTSTLGGGAGLESVDTTLGSCTPLSDGLSCHISSLAVGNVATVTVVVTPTAPGTITNTASVAGTEPDFPITDYASAFTKVRGPCVPLSNVTIAGPLTATVGSPTVFTGTVTPITSSLPVVYTWQPSEGPSVVRSVDHISDSAVFTWTTPDTHALTLTVANCGGTAAAVHRLAAERAAREIYLPLVMRQSAVCLPAGSSEQRDVTANVPAWEALGNGHGNQLRPRQAFGH